MTMTKDERTYTVSEVRAALKGADLPTYIRHKVYANLPAKVEPVLCHAGQRVYDCTGRTVGVVAYGSTFAVYREKREIVVWPAGSRRYTKTEKFMYGGGLFNSAGNSITGVAE